MVFHFFKKRCKGTKLNDMKRGLLKNFYPILATSLIGEKMLENCRRITN